MNSYLPVNLGVRFSLKAVIPSALSSVPIHKAKELMFTADLIDAATAEKMALVNHIFPAAELEDAVMQMAERLAASAPLAIGLIKKYLNNTAMTLDEVLEMEAVAQPLCMGTDDSDSYQKRRNPI